MIGLLLKSLTAEEKPSHMLLELGLLVSLLHIWLFVYLHRPAESATPPTPITMEVSLIPATAPKAPAPAPVPVAKPAPAPKKPKQKPDIAKKPATVRKQPLPKPAKAVSEPLRLPAETAAAPAPAPSLPAPPAPNPPAASAPKAQSFTEANYRANYAFNPKPEYPRIARSRGWQGKVLLRVQVSAAGVSDNVAVHRSSGHEILDESAIEAVKKWKFVPARRGDTPVASSVVVPILFSLDD